MSTTSSTALRIQPWKACVCASICAFLALAAATHSLRTYHWFLLLAIPAVAPTQYPWLPPIDTLPADMRAEVLSHRSTTAGEFALRVYREERPRTPSRLVSDVQDTDERA